MTTTSTTPGGYTSRFVAHVAQTTAHDEATSNSSNPHDRNRFRAISADGSTDERRYSAGRDEDDNKVIAATATIADYAFNVDADGDALKPPRATNTRSSRTDIITDTDKSITSSTSSHLAISEPESDLLEGSRGDSRVASVAAQDEATLVEGRSGNDEISLIVGVDRERDGSTLAIDDDTETRERDGVAFEKREKPEDAPCFLRIVVEDVDAIVGEQRTLDLMSRSVETIDEPISRDRSRSKESQTVSECSSSISGRTVSDSESESDSDSGSEEEDEGEVEDDESRDENCNVKKEKKEEDKNDSGYKGSEKCEVGEKNEDSSSSGNDEETTVLSVSSSLGESSKTPDDRYERDLKRRSASIIDERSIEEMFDDNGWVITEQDLQQDLQTMSAIPSGFGFMDDQIVEKTEDDHGGTRTEEPIPIAEREHETLDNLEDSSARSSTAIDDVEMTPPSEPGSSEGPSRSHVYKQSSLGKNGWLVSDESESESERATPPGIEVPYDRDVAQIEGIARENEASRGIEDSGIDENGWVILDDDDDDVADGRVGERSAQESTIRSQTTDLVTKTNTENGALLLANATQSKGEQSRLLGEREETRPVGAIVSIPVQMVTTVFCVSVLCYTVLTNLLL